MDKKRYSGLMLVFAGVLSGQAFGQTVQTPGPVDSGEIVVTAQKRSERLHDVPISISAFTGEQMKTLGIVNSEELPQITPGLTVTEASSFVLPFIRGIGSTVVVPGEVGSVSTYVDGVYQPVIVGAIYSLNNVDSVQVLKGPQGTLFGRNTAGGAILITTKQPSFTTNGQMDVEYGNYNDRSAGAYVSGPINQRVAVSLSGDYDAHDGYFYDILQNRHEGARTAYNIRGAVLFEPVDRLKLTLSGDYLHWSDASGILQEPRNGYLGLTAATPKLVDPYQIAQSIVPFAIGKMYGGSLRADYQMGGVKLVSITAKRFNTYRNAYDSDGTPINY